MTFRELLIELSDLIDCHEYEDGWEDKAQRIISKLESELEKSSQESIKE